MDTQKPGAAPKQSDAATVDGTIFTSSAEQECVAVGSVVKASMEARKTLAVTPWCRTDARYMKGTRERNYTKYSLGLPERGLEEIIRQDIHFPTVHD